MLIVEGNIENEIWKINKINNCFFVKDGFGEIICVWGIYIGKCVEVRKCEVFVEGRMVWFGFRIRDCVRELVFDSEKIDREYMKEMFGF